MKMRNSASCRLPSYECIKRYGPLNVTKIKNKKKYVNQRQESRRIKKWCKVARSFKVKMHKQTCVKQGLGV